MDKVYFGRVFQREDLLNSVKKEKYVLKMGQYYHMILMKNNISIGLILNYQRKKC